MRLKTSIILASLLVLLPVVSGAEEYPRGSIVRVILNDGTVLVGLIDTGSDENNLIIDTEQGEFTIDRKWVNNSEIIHAGKSWHFSWGAGYGMLEAPWNEVYPDAVDWLNFKFSGVFLHSRAIIFGAGTDIDYTTRLQVGGEANVGYRNQTRLSTGFWGLFLRVDFPVWRPLFITLRAGGGLAGTWLTVTDEFGTRSGFSFSSYAFGQAGLIYTMDFMSFEIGIRAYQVHYDESMLTITPSATLGVCF